jgi:hypothetical protein
MFVDPRVLFCEKLLNGMLPKLDNFPMSTPMQYSNVTLQQFSPITQLLPYSLVILKFCIGLVDKSLAEECTT